MTLGIGGASAIGTHTSVDGNVRGGGTPVPFADVEASFGAAEIYAQSVPYARTRYYGNPFDPSSSAIHTFDATFRVYESTRRLAFGIGYGVLGSETFRTEPPGTVTLDAAGLRLEMHGRFPTSRRSRLELTLGGIPALRGRLNSALGIPGAGTPVDAIAGSQIDATARERIDSGKTLSFAFGVRYLDQNVKFETSNALAERNAVLLPFAELLLRR